MKTTVELPDELFKAAREYAEAHGKTFKAVLVESLESTVGKASQADSRPGWERLFGAFKGDPAIKELEAVIDREFSEIDPEDWQ